MDSRYEAYCLADPLFYDSPLCPGARGPDFEVAGRSAPAGWERHEQGDWVVYAPADAVLPPQGWKVHSSGRLAEAEEIAATVFDHCIAREIPFKLVRGRELLLLRNSKYADRGSAGKLATIYPAGEAQLERLLAELGELLEGREGPYILSDLRWGKGPLYVRYGGFEERHRVREDGLREPVIEAGEGRLVPDVRGPVFELPPWVALPAFLEPHLAARNAATIDELPYRIESALHFSNAGGLYAGIERATGERVVLKEARPHAGLSSDGADAVARLAREEEMLGRLGGLGLVPAVRGRFRLGEHHFLVRDFVEGTTVAAELGRRHPLTAPDPGEAELARHAEWALSVCERAERAAATAHERGVVIGDLHPSNLVLRPDGRIALIDLEAASDVRDGERPALGDPGFLAPEALAGFDIDRHALACLRLYLFLPLTSLLALDRSKAAELAAVIAGQFPLPPAFLADAVRTIESGSRPEAGVRSERNGMRAGPGWDDRGGLAEALDAMARAILASATPEREDRLFPGDVEGLADGGGVNLAHGAAGVLYALDAAGAGRRPEHEEWLVRRTLEQASEAPLGLYDGLLGVALTLDRLGRRPDAAELLELCLDRLGTGGDGLGLDLFGGLSGIGLAVAHLARGDAALRDRALAVAELVAARLASAGEAAEVSGGDHPHAGLMRGSSGPALLFLRLHEQTGDEELLDLARSALRRDLRRCLPSAGGGLQVNEGWRTMPYLAEGGAGIGMVLESYLAVREDEELAAAAGAIRRDAAAPFFLEPGLFSGRAGMIAHLARSGGAGEAAVAAQVRRLPWHAIRYGGGIAFAGRQLVRLSMDLASGTAGVMLSLAAALGEPRAHLPFLEGLEVGARVRKDAATAATRGR